MVDIKIRECQLINSALLVYMYINDIKYKSYDDIREIRRHA